jgi:peptide/nickel transport system substrate-binding protein
MVFLQDAPAIADAKAAGVEYSSLIGGAASSLFMNIGRGVRPTADVKVRRAIASAIDVDVINERVNQGDGLPATGLIHPDQPVYPGMEGPGYDPAEARRLVAEAKAGGWDGAIGLLCNNTPIQTELSITLKAQLEAVGITVNAENPDPATVSQRLITDGNYDLACWGISIFDPGELSRLNQFASDSVRNRIGYKSPAMDAALKQLTLAVTQEQTTAALRAVQDVWNDDVPSQNLYASEWFVGWKPNVKGVKMTRDQVVRFDDVFLDD